MGLTEVASVEEKRERKPLPIVGELSDDVNYDIRHLNPFFQAIDLFPYEIDKLGRVYGKIDSDVFKVAARTRRGLIIQERRGHDVGSAPAKEKERYRAEVVAQMEVLQLALERDHVLPFTRHAVEMYMVNQGDLIEKVKQTYGSNRAKANLFWKQRERWELLREHVGLDVIPYSIRRS